MIPAPVKMLTRILCAGLCCFALSTQADGNTSSLASPVEGIASASAAPATTEVSSAAVLEQHQTPMATASESTTTPLQSAASAASVPASAPVGSSPPVTATNVGGGRHLLSVTLALFGIIVLIFAISWFVKRFGQVGFTQNQHIKIIASMPLGTRERLVLVDAAGQQLLLGITATSINTLHNFQEPVVVMAKEDRTSDFSRKLMSILQQKPGTAGENNSDNSGVR